MEKVTVLNDIEYERPINSDGESDKNSRIKQIGNIFGGTSQAGRVYDVSGLCPCLGTMRGGQRVPLIKISFDFEKPIYKADKHVYDVGGAAPTLMAKRSNKIFIKEATKTGYAGVIEGGVVNIAFPESETRRGRVIDEGATSPTLDTGCQIGTVTIENENVRIRRLTPRECFRLQGWTDDYFDKAQFVNSDSQLYKQAGNGVTVNVLYEIGKRL